METTGVTAGDIVSTASVLREVNEIYRTDYSVVRPLVGGVQSGAWLLASGQGGWAVLKWSRDRSWGGQIQRAARSVERVRDRGYPTPAWLAVGVTPVPVWGIKYRSTSPGVCRSASPQTWCVNASRCSSYIVTWIPTRRGRGQSRGRSCRPVVVNQGRGGRDRGRWPHSRSRLLAAIGSLRGAALW